MEIRPDGAILRVDLHDASTSKNVALSLDNDNPLTRRTRSGSASSGHKRNTSGSLLSRLSFLRMIQTTQNTPERDHSGLDPPDGDDLGTSLRGGRTMSSALQQRKTRRRRGSLRKAALLSTRLDFRDKKANRAPSDVLRTEPSEQLQHLHHLPPQPLRPLAGPVSPDRGIAPHEDSYRDTQGGNTKWEMLNAPQRSLATSASGPRHQQSQSKDSLLGDEITTDDEEVVSFPRVKNTNAAVAAAAAAGLHLPTGSSSSDSYFTLQADPKYRAMHRATSPLATADMTSSQEMDWDYSETEWWGWIILIVTWLVFVVGMGSCFGVWSWAWDVGETPYAPPELENDSTLPIIGYYPALIVLTAVMSWVWVIIAWVGMKYFKHANISGEAV
ncbi:hypothetical protein EYZ11_007347 [Aspergillus tanneri]|uniref:Uncharacterized protein n=1 Tax=Aspergillus tanneri TaxID=1220188 RepID=A0A4S3JFH7_9EURO|nr:uncharacterized protein ATNIH1004_000810 [Aspergillus tanneri]KAA8651911.1 hypothetical protein ATNIH1004_000810 [Aspergillus tanneri]THC93168.1 hypothetical protein EYZ11_007347 [Aspergillus tanneri]